MEDLLTVIRMELLLFKRGSKIWLFGIFMVLWGVFLVGIIHSQAYYAWLHFVISYFTLTLVLTLITGNQIQRDREQRLDSVIWSTPIPTRVYVCGKYLAMFAVVLGLATLQLLTTLVLDRLIPGAYPALGVLPYLLSWCWLVLPPLVFGLGLTLFTTTLTQRSFITALVVVFIWVFPIISGGTIPQVVNITAFTNTPDSVQDFAFSLPLEQQLHPSTDLAQQIVHRIQQIVPRAHITTTLIINRLLFLSLAVLLVMFTVREFKRQRWGSIH